jgi:hypothetical protein
VSLFGLPTISSFAGVGFQENPVAELSGSLNGKADLHLNDFHAQINWGDSNQWFTADIAPNDPNSSIPFLVKGSHIYATAGSYHIVVFASGPDGTSFSTETDGAAVSQMPSGIPGIPPNKLAGSLSPSDVGVSLFGEPTVPATADLNTGTQILAELSGSLNGKTDPKGSDFQAQVNWGDSAEWIQANVVPNPNTGSSIPFVVEASHTYYTQGDYPIVIYANGPDGTSFATQTTQANVSPNTNPPIPTLMGGVSTTVLQGQVTDNVPVGTFNDPTPPTMLTAMIDYGPGPNGTPTLGAGTIQLVSGTTYEVTTGPHMFPQPGNDTISVSLNDSHGNGTQTKATITVSSPNPLYVGGSQNEPTIAVDPTNPNRAFIASNNGMNGLFAGYSTNGGQNWTTRIIATGADGLPAACCDLKAAFDSFGNLFLTYLDNPHKSVVLLLSTDGGQHFQVLHQFQALGATADRTWVAVGPGTTPGSGSVWVTYTDSDGPGGSTRIKASGATVSGLGATNIGAFNTPLLASGSDTAQYPTIAVGPSGQVLVSYLAFDTKTRNPALFTNLDPNKPGQEQFAAQSTLVTDNEVGGVYEVTPVPIPGISVEASLAWNRAGTLHPGRVYLTYTDAKDPVNRPNDTDIFVLYSDDSGKTWHGSETSGALTPIRVNNDTGGATQFFSAIAVDQKTGYVAVAWYDTRDDSTNKQTQFYAAVSTDGLTFPMNVKASSLPSMEPAPPDGNAFGDYEGVDFVNGVIHPVWTDNSLPTGGFDTTYHITTTTIPVTVLPSGIRTSRVVAQFTSDGVSSPSGSYQAVINWGDGTGMDVQSPRVVPDPGGFQVVGSHSYNSPGVYAVQVQLTRPGNLISTTTAYTMVVGAGVQGTQPGVAFTLLNAVRGSQPGPVLTGQTLAQLPQVFAVGLDGQVYAQTFTPAGQSLGYVLTSPGTVKSFDETQNGIGAPAIFALGLDNQIYTETEDATGHWSPYTLTSPGAVQSLSLGHDALGQPEVFAIGLDNQVYTQTFNPTISRWTPLVLTNRGGVKQLRVAPDANGQPAVFVLGLDNQVYTETSDGAGHWHPYSLTNPGTVKSLTLGVDAGGLPEIFVIGQDNQVYTQTSDLLGHWHPYSLTNPGAIKAVSFGSDANGRPEIFAIGLDNQVYAQTSDGAGHWHSYALTNPGAVKAISLGLDASGLPEIFAIGLDNQVYDQTSDALGHWHPFALTRPGTVRSS